MEKIKVGVITLALPRERVDLARKFNFNAVSSLKANNLEVYYHDDLIYETTECIHKAQEYKEKGVCAILLLMGTWVDSPTVVDTIKEIQIPFAVWAEDNPASFSLTAGGIVHGSLDELGLDHKFFYGSTTSTNLLEQIITYIKACSIIHNLNHQKLCIVGGRVPGMYTTMADIIQIKNIFGVEIEHVDSLQVYLEAINAPEKDIIELKKTYLPEFGKITPEEQVIDKSIRLYFALKKVLNNKNYKIAAIKCMDEMINHYSSFCLANSLLNDEEYTISCEGDIYGAISMHILKLASGNISLFGDINHLDFQERMLRIVNCGSMPSLMSGNRKEVDLACQYDYLSKAGGVTTAFSVKDSPITGARLFRVKGNLGMLVFSGNTVKQSKERLKESREHWPQAFIKFDCDSEKLIQNFRSNHMHICFGDCLNIIKEFCSLKDISCIS
jgi:L-fucose isomerase